jgi:hypothetical protein
MACTMKKRRCEIGRVVWLVGRYNCMLTFVNSACRDNEEACTLEDFVEPGEIVRSVRVLITSKVLFLVGFRHGFRVNDRWYTQ